MRHFSEGSSFPKRPGLLSAHVLPECNACAGKSKFPEGEPYEQAPLRRTELFSQRFLIEVFMQSIPDTLVAARRRDGAPGSSCTTLLVAGCASLVMPAIAVAQDAAADLAKQLANPISSLVSMPFQYNSDSIGDGDVERLNIQPVIPLALNKDWNLITRTIVPIVGQNDFPTRGQSDAGLGDINASQFFSPKAPTAGGWIWGVGPVELLPTASQESLGSEQFGLGPTGVALKQVGPITYGALANHLWTVFGDDSRAKLNATFLQPCASIVTPTKTTFSLNAESTYDWEGGE
jgi:hypothetical protein